MEVLSDIQKDTVSIFLAPGSNNLWGSKIS